MKPVLIKYYAELYNSCCIFDDTELMLPSFKELFSLVTRVLFTLKYFECGNIVI